MRVIDSLNAFQFRETDGKPQYKLESEGADAWRPFSSFDTDKITIMSNSNIFTESAVIGQRYVIYLQSALSYEGVSTTLSGALTEKVIKKAAPMWTGNTNNFCAIIKATSNKISMPSFSDSYSGGMIFPI